MSDWGACDPSTKLQARTITTQSSGNGKACGLTSQDCIPSNVDCVLSDWGACDKDGNKSRTILTSSSGTGKVCGNLIEKCNDNSTMIIIIVVVIVILLIISSIAIKFNMSNSVNPSISVSAP